MFSYTRMRSILTHSCLLAVVYYTAATCVTVFIANVAIYVLARFYNAASFAQCCGFSNGMPTIRQYFYKPLDILAFSRSQRIPRFLCAHTHRTYTTCVCVFMWDFYESKAIFMHIVKYYISSCCCKCMHSISLYVICIK